jgi:hypothetical protein
MIVMVVTVALGMRKVTAVHLRFIAVMVNVTYPAKILM